MDEALRAKLLADAALSALVTRIAWEERPDARYLVEGKGVLVLQMVAPGREYTHDGHDGLDDTLVQVDAWARSPSVARAIALAVIPAIEPEATVDGWVIGPAFLEAEDGSRDELGGADIFRRRQDWRVFNSRV